MARKCPCFFCLSCPCRQHCLTYLNHISLCTKQQHRNVLINTRLLSREFYFVWFWWPPSFMILSTKERKSKRAAELKSAKANRIQIAAELARLDQEAKEEEQGVEVSRCCQVNTQGISCRVRWKLQVRKDNVVEAFALLGVARGYMASVDCCSPPSTIIDSQRVVFLAHVARQIHGSKVRTFVQRDVCTTAWCSMLSRVQLNYPPSPPHVIHSSTRFCFRRT